TEQDALVDDIERRICDLGEREIDSKQIGDMVVAELRKVHGVAYVRFASVYRTFKDLEDFMSELQLLLKDKDPAKSSKSAKRAKHN
ncbi:hypothetical protein KDL45_18140, partial [bacterium]|nr:hypothetical protein [bacterium]